jgi:S-DNA-T family DNA segregation ATPase FtsK/SpoIIIE
MMLTVVASDGTEHDVLLTADESTSLSAVAEQFRARFRRAARPDDAEPGLYLGEQLLPDGQPLGSSPLLEGCRVGLDRPFVDPAAAPGAIELRIVSGPGAGTVYPLGSSGATIGRDRTCTIRPPDRAMPRQAVRVRVRDHASVTVVSDASDYDGVRLEGTPVVGERTWTPGQQLAVGGLLLDVRWPSVSAEVPALPISGPTLDYEPPPRTNGSATSLPHLTSWKWWLIFPLFALVATVVAGMVLPVTLANDTLPSIAAVAGLVLSLLGVEVWQSGARARKDRERMAVERARSRDQAPDPAELLSIAAGKGNRLWERRRLDPDYLQIRWGTGDLHSAMTPKDRAVDVPVTSSLRQHGVIGLAGPANLRRQLAAWALAQLAVLQSPADVTFYLLTEPGADSGWEWLRWLPHARPTLGQRAMVLTGSDLESVARRVRELVRLIEERQTLGADTPARRRSPNVVVVLGGWPWLRRIPGVVAVVRDGPPVGVHILCLAAYARQLPEECDEIVMGIETGLALRSRGDEVWVRPDLVLPRWLEQVARALAPLRDASAGRADTLPDSCWLLDLLDLPHPTSAEIAARWQTSPARTEVVVGQTGEGPVTLDLSRDGPHALIAGASGSGKSELMRTLLASLAVANQPETMTFLLVDYKGGAAFREYTELPHTVGWVIDLDQHLATRALESLAAELRRREVAIASIGCLDLDDYARARRHNPSLAPLPRLLIVVAEFAALAAELPTFVEGLVDIAVRSRSLGVHLILATQRPSGAVGSVIRASTNLRIALRTKDAAESADVIDSPDAAWIPSDTPGRAYVRFGHRPLVAFQTAQISDVPPARPCGVWAEPLTWDMLGQPAPVPSSTSVQENGPADLETLVKAIRGAAEQLGIPAPRPPLLPPLGDTLRLSELPAPPPQEAQDLAPLVFGLEDLPAEQSRGSAVFDLTKASHLLVAGVRGSGRTQLLRTLAAAIARQHSSADVHLYGIDCGDGGLADIARLPHCGAVVTIRETDRAARLLGRLATAVRRRQELLAQGGFVDVTDQRRAVSPDRRLPHLILLVDRWESFLGTLGELYDGRLTEETFALMRGGGRVGVHVVLAGDRALLTGRVAILATDTLLLRLADPADYRMAGVNPDRLPYMVAGRALRAGSGVHLQIALLDGGPTRSGQSAALAALGKSVRQRETAVPLPQRPFRVDELSLAADRFHVGDAQGRPVGREDVLAWLRDRRAAGGSAALLGPRRAGKTWILSELSRRLAAEGATSAHQVVVPQPSSAVDTPDVLAGLLDRSVRELPAPAEALLDRARERAGTADRLAFLLDEVGRLMDYHPAAVSWLRDLGQAGAWLVYTGTEKDWHQVVRWALQAPGSSFGNDVNARVLEPLRDEVAVTFLTGTAANLGVTLEPEPVGARILELVGTWPFYLQVVGDAVVRAVQSGDSAPVEDPGALQRLVEQHLLDEWSPHFVGRWAEIGPAGRAALLRQPGATPEPSSLTPVQREDLREVGLLRPGERWLVDRPFFAWTARNVASLRDPELRP